MLVYLVLNNGSYILIIMLVIIMKLQMNLLKNYSLKIMNSKILT